MCRRTSVLIAALVLTVSFAHAQTRSGRRPPPKPTVNSSEPSVPSTRRVTITLKKGETVTGNFIGADTSTVRVQVANNELKINWDEIASIQTGDASIPNIAAIPEKPTGSVLSIVRRRGARAALRHIRSVYGRTAAKIDIEKGSWPTPQELDSRAWRRRGI